jgi:uroporphyrinogen decarboxylase
MNPLRTHDDFKALVPMEDVGAKCPFLKPILSTLRTEIGNDATLLGFVGTPWTLAAYAIEGKADKHCQATKVSALQHVLTLGDSPYAFPCVGGRHDYLHQRSAPVGGGSRAQTMMLRDPALLHSILDHFADAIAVYAIHQIDCGAQVVQLFDSWAHHLSPSQFSEFSMPYAQRVLDTVKAARPDVRSVPLPLRLFDDPVKAHPAPSHGAREQIEEAPSDV